MRKIYILLFSLSILFFSCTDNGDLPPGFENEDALYFYNINDENLVEGIEVDTIKSGDRYRVVLDKSIYKLNIYVDDRPVPIYSDSYPVKIIEDGQNTPLLVFSGYWETKYYNSKFSAGHVIRYEFYCPSIFQDEEYHTILVHCNMQHYDFKDKVYSIDNESGKSMGSDTAVFVIK